MNDLRQRLDFILHALAQLSQTQHAERVADLFQQIELRQQLRALAAAAAHEDIEDILDLGQVLLDRRRDRAHQFDAGRREAFALLFNGVIHREKFGEFERSTHGGNPSAAGGCPRDVVQQVVQ